MNETKLVVMDGQGGGVGRELIAQLKKALPEVKILAVGTNALSTGGMLRAGADAGATGSNAAVVAAREALVIAGPIGIVMADALLGEVDEKMANAVARSRACKVLIPAVKCGVYVAGASDKALGAQIADAVARIRALLSEGEGCVRA